jgi:alpha-beta hydrolase superfamily lysophospholipase
LSPALYLAAGAVFVGGIAALDRLAVRIVRPSRRLPQRSIAELGLDHEELTIPSDGRRLAAWLLHADPPAPARPLVVMAHGWGASHGTVLELARPMLAQGHDALLFDVRGHGRNEVERYVTVRHFRDDLITVVRYADERFPDRKVVLLGHSLGGAAGVLAAAEGAPIDGLVLIAAPSNVLEVTAEFLTDLGLPGGLLVRILRPFWWPKIGGTFLPLTPSRRIRELKIPILMLQPEHDQRVHRRHAERLAAAAGLEYHLIRGREHTDVLTAPETLRFIGEFLGRL